MWSHAMCGTWRRNSSTTRRWSEPWGRPTLGGTPAHAGPGAARVPRQGLCLRAEGPGYPGWLRLAAGLLLPAVVACHEASRDNPVDPALTPPVDVEVTVDDTAGTATVTWSAYGGSPPFAAYWVLRQPQGVTDADTLVKIADPHTLSFADTSLQPDRQYAYRVSTVNTAQLEVTSQACRPRPLRLVPVQLRQAEFDARTGTAALAWSRYRGAGFAS
ncbi:MAG: fibronectin type III domain-containing protein [Candidatus Latescibacterota bacterium]